MGWTIWHTTIPALINERVQSWKNDRAECKILAHAVRGRCLWKVGEYSYPDGRPTERVILLDILGSWPKTGEAGYKDVCETMGPYQLNCPLSFLDMAIPAPTSKYSVEWREAVRAYHARTARKLNVGEIVKLEHASIPEVRIVSNRPLRGEYNGKLYRIPRRFLSAA